MPTKETIYYLIESWLLINMITADTVDISLRVRLLLGDLSCCRSTNRGFTSLIQQLRSRTAIVNQASRRFILLCIIATIIIDRRCSFAVGVIINRRLRFFGCVMRIIFLILQNLIIVIVPRIAFLNKLRAWPIFFCDIQVI